MKTDKFKIVLTILFVLLACSSARADDIIQQSNLGYIGAFRAYTSNTTGCDSTDYGGYSLAFLPPNGSNGAYGSLYISSHNIYSCVLEFQIPELVTGSTLGSLNVATVLQHGVDITNGNVSKIGSGGAPITGQKYIGGLLVYGGKLYGTSNMPFGGSPVLSHWINDLTMSTSSFQGMYQISTTSPWNTNEVNVYQTVIPSAYRTQLGGPVLTGGSNQSQIASTSLGPSIAVYDPANLGSTAAPSARLLGYPSGHWTLGNGVCNDDICYATQYDSIPGMVFPDGTRSVIFTGKQGTNNYCYGLGTSNKNYAFRDGCPGFTVSPYSGCDNTLSAEGDGLQAIKGSLTSGSFSFPEIITQSSTGATATVYSTASGYIYLGPVSGSALNTTGLTWSGSTSGAVWTQVSTDFLDRMCYDPLDSSKGNHAYPYSDYFWSYDVGNADGSNSTSNTRKDNLGGNCNTLTAVKLGASNACGEALNPWDILPAKTWSFTSQGTSNPFGKTGAWTIRGAAYDPSRQRIYTAVWGGSSQRLVIQVYQINTDVPTPSYTVTAAAGANGSVNQISQSIVLGNAASITATPNVGYQIGSITGGTCPSGSWSSMTYTTGAITGDCSIGTVNFTALAPVGRSVKRISAGMW